jgi:hypothetical protein
MTSVADEFGMVICFSYGRHHGKVQAASAKAAFLAD